MSDGTVTGTPAPGRQGFHVMVKPIGPVCNLACGYCYYLEKQALFPSGSMRMTDETLELFARMRLVSHLSYSF